VTAEGYSLSFYMPRIVAVVDDDDDDDVEDVEINMRHLVYISISLQRRKGE
jgi:hypothetical protein